MIKNCTLNDLEETLYEIMNCETDFDMVEITNDEIGDDSKIFISNVKINIPELKICVREGEFCNYDPDEDDYIPDFSITLIYAEKENDPSNYLYWEQDGPMVSIYNYLHNLDMDQLGKCICMIEMATNN